MWCSLKAFETAVLMEVLCLSAVGQAEDMAPDTHTGERDQVGEAVHGASGRKHRLCATVLVENHLRGGGDHGRTPTTMLG